MTKFDPIQVAHTNRLMPVPQRATLKRLGGRRENEDCLKYIQILLSKIIVCCILRRKTYIPFYMHMTFTFSLNFLAFTDIRFDQTQPIPQMFELKINKSNTWYAVKASENGVQACPVSQI